MNIYGWFSLIAAVLFFHLGDLVYYRNPKNTANRLVMLFCIFFAYYSFCEFGYRQTRFDDVALLAYKIASFWSLGLSFLLHFILVLSGVSFKGSKRLLYVLIYGPSLAFSLIDLMTDWITAGVVQRYWGWSYVYADSLIVYLYIVWYTAISLVSICWCFWYYLRTTRKRQKKLAGYVGVGVSIIFLTGLITGEEALIPLFPTIPDLTTTAALAGGAIFIVAIIRYGFFSLSPAAVADKILSNISDAFLLANSDGKIERANQATLELLGCKREDLMGRSLTEVIAEGNASGYAGDKMQNVTNVETGFRTCGGDVIPVSLSTSVLYGEAAEIEGMVCVARDLTERKQAEWLLQDKNRQLEAANRAKSDFLSTMSHELRTPLNAVIGFSELMLDGVPGEVNEEQKACLKDIMVSGYQLLNLVNDVLDLSKVEAGKVSLSLESVSIREIVESAVQTVTPQLVEHRHNLAVNIGDLPRVWADVFRLRQVFLNLLSNAIKFTPDGGNLSIGGSVSGDYCQLYVADNGVGISREDRQKLFEPFFQGGAVPQGVRKGTGLGLAICKGLLGLQGGQIWVESEEGRGSRFIFTVPLAKE